MFRWRRLFFLQILQIYVLFQFFGAREGPVWIKLSLIEFESCLKLFDSIQTHLSSRAPAITVAPLTVTGPHP
jgi:hypothetical protein